MQASTSAFSSTPLPLPLQNVLQSHPSVLNDHELKKKYLGLLPPQHIIEICLAFEAHAPIYLKNTVWPGDFGAAIAALQSQQVPAPPSAVTPQNEPPIMDSLVDDTQSPSPSHPSPTTDPPEPPSTGEPSSMQLPPAQPSNVPVNIEPPPQPQPPPQPPQQQQQLPPPQPQQQQQPMYAQQPYGYGRPQTAAYPHTPYYPPPAYASYPPLPGAYPPSGYPPPQQAVYPVYNHAQEPYNPSSGEDLPSYEEMICEALAGCPDPDGCAPKEVFAWMASRYPLQSNFRPSASQALQKAFKRGRLIKVGGGKYKQNPSWEGGNTSRRTTRRPQTQSQTALPNLPHGGPGNSPFTHAPLVHHPPPPPSSTQTPYSGSGYTYSYPTGYLAYPPQQQQQQQQTQQQHPPPEQQQQSQQANEQEEDTSEGSGAWEAAQNILRAINFGDLLQITTENDETSTAPPPASVAQPPSTHPLPIFAGAGVNVSVPAVGPIITPVTVDGTSAAVIPDARAGLQAQLALLAAQLAEIAQAGEDVLAASAGSSPGSDDDDLDDMDMDVDELDELDDSEEDEDDMEEVDVTPLSIRT